MTQNLTHTHTYPVWIL